MQKGCVEVTVYNHLEIGFILVVFFPTYISELMNYHFSEYFWLTALITNSTKNLDIVLIILSLQASLVVEIYPILLALD